MNQGEKFCDALQTILSATGLMSHAEFLIVSNTSCGNNFYTDRELEREVVGEPVAEYLKPFLPTITQQMADESLARLLASGLLRGRSVKFRKYGRYSTTRGYVLTTKGKRVGRKVEAMWRELTKPTPPN